MMTTKFSQTGSMLIEALVALVVVAVGTFGVVKLNTVMLSGTGLSKTRAEALQIALTRMEDIRSTSCPAAGDTTETDLVTGVNASYKVGQSISNVTSDRVNVDICVAWDGSNAPCTAPPAQRVILKSLVSCTGMGTSGMVGGDAIASTGGKLKTPTGAARVGGRDYGSDKPALRTLNYLGGGTSGTADGTSTFLAADGKRELIDEVTGRVLLTVDDGSAFSTISGRVYIEADNSGDPIVGSDLSDTLFVLSSDASYCARVIPDSLPVVPTNATGNDIKYRYLDYRCYVSKGWWGNIGIVRVGSADDKNRICVGDTAVSSIQTSIWSKKSALSISRGYRSYREKTLEGVGTGIYETIGIGFDTATGLVYTATNIPSTANASTEHHDFLVAAVKSNETCAESGKMDLTSPSKFAGNQGKFYCMSGQCPGLTETVSSQATVVQGTITKASGAELTGIDPADCYGTPTFTSVDASTYSYSCTKNWTGFAGSAWQGGVTFTTATGNTTTICANTNRSLPNVTPSTSHVSSNVNDKTATSNPNSLSFTDVPLGVTNINIDFNAEPTSCNRLTPPDVYWANGNTPKDLRWGAITGATGYEVRSCENSNSTDCIPATLSTQPGTSVSPGFTTPTAIGIQTFCFGITATDSSGASNSSFISTTKCVTRTVTAKNNGFGIDYAVR